jgi:hypothetical protein
MFIFLGGKRFKKKQQLRRETMGEKLLSFSGSMVFVHLSDASLPLSLERNWA